MGAIFRLVSHGDHLLSGRTANTETSEQLPRSSFNSFIRMLVRKRRGKPSEHIWTGSVLKVLQNLIICGSDQRYPTRCDLHFRSRMESRVKKNPIDRMFRERTRVVD